MLRAEHLLNKSKTTLVDLCLLHQSKDEWIKSDFELVICYISYTPRVSLRSFAISTKSRAGDFSLHVFDKGPNPARVDRRVT